jgi:hypothetical protein
MTSPSLEFVGPRSVRPWATGSFQLPPQIPTMITKEEARYLNWLTATFWDDSGHVVEMGPWLGGSTYCLASGMARPHGESKHRLHVFDSFEWRDFMASRAPLELQAGASFEDHFRQNVSSFGDLVLSRRAVLPDELLATDASLADYRAAGNAPYAPLTWQEGPIQLLFIDGAKSWTGMVHLLKQTAPHWLAGRTVVVCQDYKHWGCYWVTALVEVLSHRLRVLHVIEKNTVTFVVESKPTEAELAALPSFADTSVTRSLELIEAAAQRLHDVGDRGGAAIVRLGKVPMLVHKGKPDEALREFRRQEARWLARGHERSLVEARNWLAERLGRPLSEGRRHAISRNLLSLAALGRRNLRRLTTRS